MIFWIGLGTVSVPIIIHLLNRRRFRIRRWAAMQFLLDSLRRNRRRLRIEELILMALRCLALFLLAMAIARFAGCGDSELIGGGQTPETTIFVLDDSFSMDHKVGAATILDSAVKDLTARIKRLAKNAKADRIAVILTSGPDTDEPFQALMPVAGESEVEQLVARLESIESSDSPARLGEAISAAGEILAAEDGPKNVFIYSDFRRVDLGEGAGGQYQPAIAALKEQDATIVVMDYGRSAKSNLTIEKIELLDKFALAGSEARMALTVRNNGLVRVENVSVSLSARWRADDENEDAKAVLPKTIPVISPGATVRAEFNVTPHAPGPAVIEAKLPPDHLDGDNTAYLALDVRKAVRVLIVDGRPDMSDRTMSESYRIALLLDPQKNVSHGNDVTVVTVDALEAQDLSSYDVVMLLDVARLTSSLDGEGKVVYPELKALERYVREGGGLAIFTGSSVNLAFYNGPMYAEGTGLSPLVIAPPQGDAVAREKYRRIDARSVAGDPFLRALQGEEGAVRCGFIRFYAFTPADPMTASAPAGDIKPPRILAKFTSPDGGEGPPAIVSRQFGTGVVIMFYSTASTRWNDWADDQPEYIYSTPMIDVVGYLTRSQAERFTMTVGEGITHEISQESRDAQVTVLTPRFPADDVITLEAVVEDDGGQPKQIVRYDNTIHAGCYTLQLKMPDESQTRVFFARNVNPVEGDLTPGGQRQIVRAFGSEDFKYVRRIEAGSPDSVETKEQKEYWILLLAAMLAVLAMETVLAQRFGHYSSS